MKKPDLLQVREVRCHCGYFSTMIQSSRQCCLICRCDEHDPSCGYRLTDTMPGCGASCINHPEEVRLARIEELVERAATLNRKGN